MSSGLSSVILMVLIFIAAAGIATVGVVNVLSGGTVVQERLQAYAVVPDLQPARKGRRNTALIRWRLRLNSMLSALASDELNLLLMSANWHITVTEYLLIRFGATLAGLIFGWLISGTIISGVALAILAYMVPGVLLKRAIHQRQQQFEKQLIDVLVLINGAVRAGFSLLQAIEVVEKEMNAPASEEFKRVRHEVGLGLSLSQALDNLSSRMKNRDLDMVVTSVKIQFQVGGNLSTMISAVTDTIRERIRLFSEVRVITTQQRYTSYLLSLLPIFLGSIFFIINPDHMRRLFQPGMICVPIGSAIGIILGHFALQRITKIEV